MSQLIRRLLKAPLLVGDLFTPKPPNGYTFLIYHAVTGRLPMELDLDFPLFRRQMEHLAQQHQVTSFEDALTNLRAGTKSDTPRFVLTFDDGYLDFYTHVFPLLKTLNLPAILYVTTGFIEDRIPYPIRRHNPADVQPVTWEMLHEMHDSGLVTIGAHTHTHPDLSGLPEAQLEDELTRPLEIIEQRLGIQAHHFCYPRARWDPQVEAKVARHYQTAVISGGQPVTAETFSPHRIARLPVRRSDGWFFFRHKLQGRLQNEEAFYARLHRLRG